MSVEPPQNLKHILIVGGGTAGWLTAAFLARTLGTETTGGPAITVLESPDIGSVGVGEGSFPSIRGLLRHLGVDEAEFVQATGATFKQGIRFDGWQPAGKQGAVDSYFHPFDTPFTGRNGLNPVRHWLTTSREKRRPFAEAVTFQKALADADLSPKLPHQGQFEGLLTYAYHFDASKFGAFLSRYAMVKGVHHLQGRVTAVCLATDGAIAHVLSDRQGEISADVFIDCSGFRSELLGKALGTPFKSVKDVLLTDRAVTCQLPYPNEATPLPSYTISTAHEAGWIWDIALATRRGVGYVYASQFSSDERAREVLRSYTGDSSAETRTLSFAPGYRTAHWVKNCIAVGLSGGFVEPLEATGLVLIEAAVFKIAEFLTFRAPYDRSAAIFNEQMVRKYENIVLFLKLHYCLSRRGEPFWRQNARPDAIPDRLAHMLEIWKERPPSRFDFIEDYETFAYTSYQFILYGMGFQTSLGPSGANLADHEAASALFEEVKSLAVRHAQVLPAHRVIIDLIASNGFDKAPNHSPNYIWKST